MVFGTIATYTFIFFGMICFCIAAGLVLTLPYVFGLIPLQWLIVGIICWILAIFVAWKQIDP